MAKGEIGGTMKGDTDEGSRQEASSMCATCGCGAHVSSHAQDHQEAKTDGGSATGGTFHAVAAVDDVGDDELLGVDVAGQPVVIGRVGGQLCAIGGLCTHRYARLADGDLEDGVVSCPLHNAGFDLRTGAVVRGPAQTPVPTYTVTVEGDRILVSAGPPPGEGR